MAEVIQLLDPLASVIVGVLEGVIGGTVWVDEDEGAVVFEA
jgi:hypothetical protein